MEKLVPFMGPTGGWLVENLYYLPQLGRVMLNHFICIVQMMNPIDTAFVMTQKNNMCYPSDGPEGVRIERQGKCEKWAHRNLFILDAQWVFSKKIIGVGMIYMNVLLW